VQSVVCHAHPVHVASWPFITGPLPVPGRQVPVPGHQPHTAAFVQLAQSWFCAQNAVASEQYACTPPALQCVPMHVPSADAVPIEFAVLHEFVVPHQPQFCALKHETQSVFVAHISVCGPVSACATFVSAAAPLSLLDPESVPVSGVVEGVEPPPHAPSTIKLTPNETTERQRADIASPSSEKRASWLAPRRRGSAEHESQSCIVAL
jgi:hypothetical protein